MYALRDSLAGQTPPADTETDEAVADAREMGLINAFGMYWSRASVRWKTSMPNLCGLQQFGSTPVNFTAQAGVYLLYDGRTVVYVGKVTEPRMLSRGLASIYRTLEALIVTSDGPVDRMRLLFQSGPCTS